MLGMQSVGGAGKPDRLLVVGPPSALDGPLVARAELVARALGLEIYFYYPLTHRVSAMAMAGMPAAAASGATSLPRHNELYERSRDELEEAVAGLRSRGLAADGRVEWTLSHVTAVLDEVDETEPRLVMIAAEPHGRLADAVSFDDDLELVRLCPAPLWLVRGYPRNGRIVLAAVDPTHAEDRACAVDHAVLREATEFARLLGKEIHAVHTFTLPAKLRGVIAATVPELAEERYQRTDDHHALRMHALTDAHGISKEHVHLRSGDLIRILHSLADSLDVDVIVTGALSRSRLKRKLIGGTAERLFRAIETDLLVVKDGPEEA